MKWVWMIILAILTLLAISSGATKVMLMQQEVDFFGKYGFSSTAIIFFGALQLLGGVLLPFKKTRFMGAAVIALTFLISLVLLILDGNAPLSAVTAVVTILLVLVMARSRRLDSSAS